MKKIVLVLAIIAATTYAADAQIRFGLKAGLNGYDFKGDDLDDYETKLGLHFGGLVNIPVSENFSIQPELLYSDEGGKYSESGYTDKYNLSYLNIPILAQLNTSSGFYAEVGPQVGFLLSAKNKWEYEGEEDSEDVKEYFKGINFSAAIGAGYRHSSGFGIGARYNLGLANVLDEDTTEGSSAKLSGFQVGVSFLFGGSGGEAKKAVTKAGY